jgi:3-deoxy-7-phosphoheptulonate synthase
MPNRASRTRPLNSVALPPVESSVPFDKTSLHLDDWAPESWRQREALQQPNYPDQESLKKTIEEIEKLPPLVFAGECRLLQTRLAAGAKGEAFLLFGKRSIRV